MLTIVIPESEFFNSETNEFVQIKGQKLQLEHSLKSISKWESKWHKPFLSKEQKTKEETLDYIRCMTLNDNVDPIVFHAIPESEKVRIADYIQDPMTATTIRSDNNAPKNRNIITSEILYYDMVALNIPFECENWHLNRLIMLIEVCNEKNKPKKKIPKSDLARRNRSLNAARRKRIGTTG